MIMLMPISKSFGFFDVGAVPKVLDPNGFAEPISKSFGFFDVGAVPKVLDPNGFAEPISKSFGFFDVGVPPNVSVSARILASFLAGCVRSRIRSAKLYKQSIKQNIAYCILSVSVLL